MKRVLIIMYLIIATGTLISCQMDVDFSFVQPILNSADGAGEPG